MSLKAYTTAQIATFFAERTLVTRTRLRSVMTDIYSALTKLGSTSNGEGASLIAIEDAGGFTSAADVEAALAELAPLRMRIVADPGTGVAIPVTASADIAIVTGASGQTNTLPDPPAAMLGGFLHLWFLTDGGGDRVITAASPINATGNTVMTFASAGQRVILQAVRDGASAYRWSLILNGGTVALS